MYYYYYLPEPPYFLIFVGLFISIASGLAFEATLKEVLNKWQKTRTPKNLQQALNFNLLFPFLGICAGVCLFLASGLEVFLFSRWISYSISFPVTLFVAALVWIQLGRLMEQLQEGGSKAIDLDAF
jgi:hypothetical protein